MVLCVEEERPYNLADVVEWHCVTVAEDSWQHLDGDCAVWVSIGNEASVEVHVQNATDTLVMIQSSRKYGMKRGVRSVMRASTARPRADMPRKLLIQYKTKPPSP